MSRLPGGTPRSAAEEPSLGAAPQGRADFKKNIVKIVFSMFRKPKCIVKIVFSL
jgi:hypothetical protein